MISFYSFHWIAEVVCSFNSSGDGTVSLQDVISPDEEKLWISTNKHPNEVRARHGEVEPYWNYLDGGIE